MRCTELVATLVPVYQALQETAAQAVRDNPAAWLPWRWLQESATTVSLPRAA